MAKQGKQGTTGKKSLYKRIGTWVSLVLALAVIGVVLGACSSDNSSKNTTTDKKSSATTSSKAATSSKKAATGKISRAQFDAIKIGDLMSGANGGATIAQLQKQFGKPSSTTTENTNGVKTDMLTWTNVDGGFGANIIVSFTNGKAFGKNLTGFKLSRKQNITLANFNSWQNGMKYAAFTAKYGQPDSYNENLIGGQKTVIGVYMSGVKGDLGANLSVTFTNGALTGKTQSNMK